MAKKNKMVKTHKYQLTIEFESMLPLKAHKNFEIQFENGIPYFAEVTKAGASLNADGFLYGTGKAKLKKTGTGYTENES